MKPLDHPDYLIEGTSILNFSKWSRENIPKSPPAFAVGDRVLVPAVVRKVYQDCDGTPLFAVGSDEDDSRLWYGYVNENLAPAPPKADEP